MPVIIAEPLLIWYDKNKRILPWRDKDNAYYTWVSEIMLQQTRVEAVKPYFQRFIQELPDVAALAAAPEERIIKLWEGLGYYSRVRNMQKAAVQVMEEYGGRIPEDFETLLSLKGIGRYTAGAIASIAYGKKVPAVDGNVLRVYARLTENRGDIMKQSVRKSVENDLTEQMSEDRPGDFNQAMMEIGACVCIPNGAPHCEECPLQQICLANADGTQLQYPNKAKAKERTVEEKTILIIRDAELAALHKRPAKGLLAGMYEFPSMKGYHTAEEVKEYLAENGLQVLRIQPLEDAKHIFSHREWHMKGYLIRVDELAPKREGPDSADWIYIEPSETREKYPIPSAFAVYAKGLNMKLGARENDPGQ